MDAKRHLDRAQSRTALAELAAAPEEYARLVGEELGVPPASLAELDARDAALTQALAHIDALAARVMRLELDHALADDSSIAPPTRKVFASTIVSYANNLGTLEDRATDMAARGRSPNPHRVGLAVLGAAHHTLDLRESLLQPVLALVRDLAQAAIADADKRAKDRTLDDATRMKWSAARRELEALSAQPARIVSAPWATRIAEHPDQLDEPAPEAEVTFADMIELD